MSRSLFARLHRCFGPKLSGSNRIEVVSSSLQIMGRTFLTYKPKEVPRRINVGIVGGGFAGLAAGYYISERGGGVTVFEASNRVGGRVRTRTDIPRGRLIEAGGELVGLNHPIWLDLALKFRLGLTGLTDESHIEGQRLMTRLFLKSGEFSGKRAERLYFDMSKVLDELCTEASVVNADEPWNTLNASKLDNMNLGDWLDQKTGQLKLSQDCRDALEVEFSNNNGAPTDEQSVLFNLAIIQGGGGKNFWDNVEVFRCAKGNEALAHSLKKAIRRNKGRVFTNHPVRQIKVDKAKGVDVWVGAGMKKHSFDYLVLAIPPTTWHKITVDPSIDPNDYKVTMGKAIKFLSPLNERVWIRKQLAPTSTSHEYGMTWEGTDNQTQRDNETVEISLFAGGPAATKRANYFRNFLQQAYPGYSRSLVKPGAQLVNWPKEKWVLCGYSCLSPGEVMQKAINLADPFYDRMYFAGEHTCPAFYGYMEGALNSGYRVALQILRSHGWKLVPLTDTDLAARWSMMLGENANVDQHIKGGQATFQ